MKNSGMIGWLTLNRVVRRWKRDEEYYTESHKSSKKFMKNLLKFKQIKKIYQRCFKYFQIWNILCNW